MSTVIDNLRFSLNATIPIFLMMVLGLFLKKINFFSDSTISALNKFAFRILLPALLFHDLASADIKSVWDGKYVVFCFTVTLMSILIASVVSLIIKNKSERGEFIQASYRSSAAIMGIAFVNNIFGQSTMAALMIVATVPLYNVVAVIVLALTAPEENKDKTDNRATIIKTVKNILTNPIILGIVVGMVWGLLEIPQPVILSKSVSYLANMASPISLIALGASFRFENVKGRLGYSLLSAFIKLVLFGAVFVPLAYSLGFEGEKMIAILVMLGSCTTCSCFIMAKNMGHEGSLTACTVMLTTLFSAFTLTGWLFILKMLEIV